LSEDPNVARILLLRDREEREQSGLFYIQGVRFVNQAVETRAAIETVVVCPPLLQSPLGQILARRLKRAGTPCLKVAPDIFRQLSFAHDYQGIGAVVRQQWTPLSRARAAKGLCWVALRSVQAPGNFGTILRTCEAVGAAGLLLIGSAVDPYDPATVRASMGSVFGRRFVRTDFYRIRRWVRRHNGTVVGTSAHGGVDYDTVRYRSPVILLMGNERKGLTESELDLCDVVARIPMVGRTDSLNLGVATSLMLYEVFRQRRRR
jgi:TrmH family RNA methyltransferase